MIPLGNPPNRPALYVNSDLTESHFSHESVPTSDFVFWRAAVGVQLSVLDGWRLLTVGSRRFGVGPQCSAVGFRRLSVGFRTYVVRGPTLMR